MSAVEEIETAIARLTELRDSTVATWEIDGSLIRGDGWILAEVKKAGNEQTANLIVTLHRTIDAQLAILRGVGTRPVSTIGLRPYDVDALTLAIAINGTAS